MDTTETIPSPSRRKLLVGLGGLVGLGLLSACTAAPAAAPTAAPQPTTAPAAPTAAAAQPTVAAKPAAAPTTAPAVASGDLNAQGWPKSIDRLSIGLIPLEDQVQQKATWKPFMDFVQERLGVPVDLSITTSYAALVEAQRTKQVVMGYYGALSFLLAEQRFGAVPIVVDSTDGVKPGNYHSLLMAGKDSPVKTIADIKGKDFSFVDPASTSGNLFPRVMLLDAGIDPAKDIRGRFAGNHQNSILAVAKGQVPAGASNDLSLDQAVSQNVIAKDDIVILKTSADIPNGPFAVAPDLDPHAKGKLVEAMGAFKDAATLKKMALVGPVIPVKTSDYDFVRQAAKVLNLEFDDKGNPKEVG